jgi:hypothetical protein
MSYKVKRTTVNRVQYLMEPMSKEFNWTTNINEADAYTLDVAKRQISRASQLDAQDVLTSDPIVLEYSIVSYEEVTTVEEVGYTVPPVVPPSTQIAKKLIYPLSDALNLAGRNNKLNQLAELIRTGNVTLAELIVAISK